MSIIQKKVVLSGFSDKGIVNPLESVEKQTNERLICCKNGCLLRVEHKRLVLEIRGKEKFKASRAIGRPAKQGFFQKSFALISK